MRRFASSLLVLLARGTALFSTSGVMLGVAGCGEDGPEQLGSPFDGGGQGLCATCGSDGGLASQGDGGVAAPQCAALDPGACSGHPACASIVGLAYDSGRYCRGEAQLPVGCQSREVECGFGPIRVVDSAGQRWLLPNRCIPPGYNPAPTETHPIAWIEGYTVCPSASLQTRCSQLDERGCAANESCFAQMGTELNERRSCKEGTPHFVACVQNTLCNRVLTYARDPLGNTWELISSCLPSGYTALPPSSVGSHTNWSTCAF